MISVMTNEILIKARTGLKRVATMYLNWQNESDLESSANVIFAF